jgi:uncharacterized membrane protein YkoI
MLERYKWPLILMAGLLALGLGRLHADDDDHLLARRALQEGRVLPLSEILGKVKTDLPGKVIEVELEVDDGIFVYDLKILAKDGRVMEVEVDAASGKILKREDDD